LQDALAAARHLTARVANKEPGPYLSLAKLNYGFVGWSFFDFFNGFFAFLAIFLSLARFAQLGTGVLIGKAPAKVHIHFSAPRPSVSLAFQRIRRCGPAPHACAFR
jgi:hypothetical protein